MMLPSFQIFVYIVFRCTGCLGVDFLVFKAKDADDQNHGGPRLVPTRGLFRQSDLFHICLVIPKKMFFDDNAVFPNSDCRHRHLEGFSRRLNEFAVSDRHRFCKRSFKDMGTRMNDTVLFFRVLCVFRNESQRFT